VEDAGDGQLDADVLTNASEPGRDGDVPPDARGADAAPDAGDAATEADPGYVGAYKVTAELPLDLGHVSEIVHLRQVNDRVLSQDHLGHWVLWDVATRAQLASGDSPFPPFSPSTKNTYQAPRRANTAIAGSTLMVINKREIQVRSSTNGALLATISEDSTSVPSQFGVATDGSYVFVGDSDGVKAWSRTGSVLLSTPATPVMDPVMRASRRCPAPCTCLVRCARVRSGAVTTAWTLASLPPASSRPPRARSTAGSGTPRTS